jgi:uracil-DNA glycosylase family 4
VDAKDRLRLYLEQRRELGESELVLDALPVDEVLRMIGAPKTLPGTAGAKRNEGSIDGGGSASNVAPPPKVISLAPPADSPIPTTYAPPPPPPMRTGASSTSNWREVLQANAPPASTNSPITNTSSANTSSDNSSRDSASPLNANAPSMRGATLPLTNVPAWLAALDIPFGLSAVPVSALGAPSPFANLADLDAVASVIAGCRACALGATALNPVPGEGNPSADLVCVGEAPGQSEDESGRPFVGAAGQLLTKILAAIQLSRDDVFICNVLKHRPPGNRNPMPEEVHACTPYLTRQLELLRPKVILALGTFAAQTLLNTQIGLGKLRGQVHTYQGIPLIVTYHPAALLRNEAWKRPAWDDVKMARRILDAARAAAESKN